VAVYQHLNHEPQTSRKPLKRKKLQRQKADRLAAAEPELNAYAERWVRSVKEDA
jgi:hypothetical protein